MNLAGPKRAGRQIVVQVIILLMIAAALCVALAVAWFVPAENTWIAGGIAPREVRGLFGILIAPLHHADANHLRQNLLPLLLLGWTILLEGPARFWKATGWIILGSGLLIWALGSAQHLYFGSSALVFGYMGFILMRAYARPRHLWLALAVACGIVFGGQLLVSTFGSNEASWLGHISGLAVGTWCGALMHRPKSALDGI